MSWQQDFISDYGLPPAAIKSLERLLVLLQAANDRNLTTVRDESGIVDLHFRDSLHLIGEPVFITAARIVDVGSGAGFPGLPLAIAAPEKNFTLLESVSRKCEFISSAASELGLGNVTVLNSRAEDAGRSTLRDHFDLALARAVGPFAVVIEYVMPLIKTGGSALLQRGAREAGDEKTAAAVASLLGGKLESLKSVKPYPEAANLHLWHFSKISPTPDRFPRRPGMAKKRPLHPGA